MGNGLSMNSLVMVAVLATETLGQGVPLLQVAPDTIPCSGPIYLHCSGNFTTFTVEVQKPGNDYYETLSEGSTDQDPDYTYDIRPTVTILIVNQSEKHNNSVYRCFSFNSSKKRVPSEVFQLFVPSCPEPSSDTTPSVNGTDPDVCSTGNHNCSYMCMNAPQGFQCICPNGYQLGDDRVSCEDVDECSEGNHNCTEHQQCVNTEGNFYCTCIPGYQFDQDTLSCISVDSILVYIIVGVIIAIVFVGAIVIVIVIVIACKKCQKQRKPASGVAVQATVMDMEGERISVKPTLGRERKEPKPGSARNSDDPSSGTG